MKTYNKLISVDINYHSKIQSKYVNEMY